MTTDVRSTEARFSLPFEIRTSVGHNEVPAPFPREFGWYLRASPQVMGQQWSWDVLDAKEIMRGTIHNDRFPSTIAVELLKGNLQGHYASMSQEVEAPIFYGNLHGTHGTLTSNLSAPVVSGNLEGHYASMSQEVEAPIFYGNLHGTHATLTSNLKAFEIFASNRIKSPLFVGNISGDVTILRTFGNQTVDGVKTFSSTVQADISGNAQTVTDGVYVTRTIGTGLENSGLTGGGTLEQDLDLRVDDTVLRTFGDQIKRGNLLFDGGTRCTGTYSNDDFCVRTNSKDRVHVTSSGEVGIGTYPDTSFRLDVLGAIRATGEVTAFSDARLKTDVRTIESALDKVQRMRGVTFQTKDGETRRRVGLIAQDVEAVIPEAVITDTTKEKWKSIAYGNLVAVLVEAIKDLSTEWKQFQQSHGTNFCYSPAYQTEGINISTPVHILRGRGCLTWGSLKINVEREIKLLSDKRSFKMNEVQCFVQNESSWNPVKASIHQNTLTILSQNPDSNDQVSWMVCL